jgi:hypothetical protein
VLGVVLREECVRGWFVDSRLFSGFFESKFLYGIVC